MNKKLFLLLLAALLAWLAGGSTPAPVRGQSSTPETSAAALGTAFTYQGHLLDGTDPANGNYDFRFILYDAESGGAQVGSTLTLEDVPISEGYFTAQLDFGAGVFTGQARWLEVSVRPGVSTSTYTVLSPRQALNPAPAALYASQAGSVPWSSITGMPAGFADGIDNDTTSFWDLKGNPGTDPAINYLGTSDNQALELRVNGQRAFRLEPNETSPNLIGGYSENAVVPGVVGATIAGGGTSGYVNQVYDNYGTIGGGYGNTAGSNDSPQNPTNAEYTTVGGGYMNSATGYLSTASGGQNNLATGNFSTISGGGVNTAEGEAASVSGGDYNHAIGEYSTIGGGILNTASGGYSTVAGGYWTSAGGEYSYAAGYYATASHIGSFVWSSSGSTSSWGDYTFTARSSGGARFYTTSSGTSTGVQLPAGGGSWSSLSDRNAKTNVIPVNSQQVLDALAALPLNTWSYTSQDSSIRHMGPMAQDFYAAFNLGEDERYIGSLDADGVALTAIQGLYQRNQEQAQQIQELENKLARLEQGEPSAPQPNLPTPWLVLSGFLACLVIVQAVMFYKLLRQRGQA